MIKLPRRMTTRECVLATATIVVVLGFCIYQRWILPAYDQWLSGRALVKAQTSDYTRLAHNLARKKSVDAQFKMLGDTVWQTASDLATMAEFVREVQMLANQPSITVKNLKGLAVKTEGRHKIYPVRLSVSGSPMEIVQFIRNVMNGPMVTGLESFMIRGVQGGYLVECSFSIWMVRLIMDEDEFATLTSKKT